jgi:DNA-binding GntR family transcriptional regulator
MEAFHRREAAQAEQAMQEHLSRQRDVLRDLDPGAPGEAVGQEAPPGKVKSSKP